MHPEPEASQTLGTHSDAFLGWVGATAWAYRSVWGGEGQWA